MKSLGNVFIVLSLLAMALAIVGAEGVTNYHLFSLASTQWLLVAATLGIYAVYVKHS